MIAIIWCAVSRYKRITYKSYLINAIETTRKQLKIGEHKTVYLENKFGADLCVIFTPYMFSEILDKKLGSETTFLTRKRIGWISSDGEENFSLIFIKNKKMVFHCYLPYIAINPDLDALLVTKIKNEKISIEFVKVDNERNLEIINLE